MVSLDLVLHDAQGELIHSSDAPVVYLHGGYGGSFEALERALAGVALRPASLDEIGRGAIDEGAQSEAD